MSEIMDGKMGGFLARVKEKGAEPEFLEYFYTIMSACVMHSISPTPEMLVHHAEIACEQALKEV